jgi:hypothetical protein
MRRFGGEGDDAGDAHSCGDGRISGEEELEGAQGIRFGNRTYNALGTATFGHSTSQPDAKRSNTRVLKRADSPVSILFDNN